MYITSESLTRHPTFVFLQPSAYPTALAPRLDSGPPTRCI